MDYLAQLQNGLLASTEVNRKADFLKTFIRLKESTPFSQRLNLWIIGWFNSHKDTFIFTDEDDFDQSDIKGTLEKYKQRYLETGKIHIWTGSSDTTIFGTPEVNWFFRAWHDYTHITNNLGFDFVGESIVGTIQNSQLPENWFFEKELITAEILGQNQHYRVHKDYVNNQRQFIVEYIKNPLTFLTQKF